jgi:hypothetical protein
VWPVTGLALPPWAAQILDFYPDGARGHFAADLEGRAPGSRVHDAVRGQFVSDEHKVVGDRAIV